MGTLAGDRNNYYPPNYINLTHVCWANKMGVYLFFGYSKTYDKSNLVSLVDMSATITQILF